MPTTASPDFYSDSVSESVYNSVFPDSLYNIDFAILNAIQEHCRSPLSDSVLSFISHLGDLGTVWLLISLLLVLRRRTRTAGISLLIALFTANLLGNFIIKPLVERPRPFWLAPPADLLPAALRETSFSFPSGHTISSFAAACALMTHSRRLGIPALLLACLIAFSRLYLYVHFPSDVLTGMILGIICGILSGKLTQKFIHK